MKIAEDKWRHFWVGIPMGSIVQIVAHYISPGDMVAASILALLAVVGISYGFELFSKVTGKGHHDVMDALASILGGIVGMGLTIAILLAAF
ncbi:hypothetical protein [Chitinophaga sp. YIM B06452]|uniref:hypothetical protein n=1 Tax=Chitinophaga sp. YIM B06452 TaxID=3082158 RepID=UPI0031FEA8E4